MTPKFICHPLFENAKILNVFHKEMQPSKDYSHPGELLNKHILFRRRFTLGKIKKATLKISADDYYKLYINGIFVTQGPAPSYPSSYFYNELDVTSYLKEGENVIAVHTYYQGLINRVWVSGDLRQMLWLSLDTDGSTVLVSDETWKCALHSGYTECGRFGYDTQFAECYDSASSERGFYLPDFDDSSWGYAGVFKNADYTLVKQETAQLDLYSIAPVIAEMRNNTLFLDFGQEYVGYLTATAIGKSGDEILLRFGEELNKDGSVRYKMRCNCVYEEKWLLSGETDTLMEYDYKAFRYCEIIYPDGVTLSEVKMLVRHYPYEQKAVYSTENEALKKVLRLCLDTMKYGTQEGFLDCPTREKGSYLGDISIAGRSHAVATGDTAFMKKAVLQFCDTSDVCPGILAVSSSSLMQEIADYSLQFAAQLLWIYKTDGDLEFLKRTEPYATGIYEYFLKYADERGLLSSVTEKWNLVDWPKNLRDGYDFEIDKPIGAGYHNVINAFWYGSLTALDEIYEVLGKPRITGYVEKVKSSFFDTFYCEDAQLFSDSPREEKTPHFAIHSNVLPLLFGMTDGKPELKASIVSLIEKKSLASMGVYMAYFTLAALAVNDELALAEKLATDERCWLNMIKEGGTTTFEAWGVDQKWNTSLLHPWATAPVIIFADGAVPY